MTVRHVLSNAQNIAVILTLVVVIVYTAETHKLRTAATDQLVAARTQNRIASENAIRPIVILGSQDDLPHGIHKLVIRNVGSGPALNTVTRDISVHSDAGASVITLVHRTALAPAETQDVSDLTSPDNADKTLSPIARLASRIGTETVHACIVYDNANSERYETWQTLYLPKSSSGQYLPLDYLAIDFTCYRKTPRPCSQSMSVCQESVSASVVQQSGQ
jgi:hypothetical protein